MKKQFVSILAAITILCNLCFTEVYAFEDSTSALKEFTSHFTVSLSSQYLHL